MSFDLGKQFKSLLEPEMMEEGFVDQTLKLKIHRFPSGSASDDVEDFDLGPLPRWFTLYEVKLALWNSKQRNPSFSPALVFMGIRHDDEASHEEELEEVEVAPEPPAEPPAEAAAEVAPEPPAEVAPEVPVAPAEVAPEAPAEVAPEAPEASV